MHLEIEPYLLLPHCSPLLAFHKHTIRIITTCTNTIFYAIYNDIYAINIIYTINISYHHTDIKLVEANPTA